MGGNPDALRSGGTRQPRTAPGGTAQSAGAADPLRVSNLTLACHYCNQAKGTQTAAGFGYPHLRQQAKAPLKDAAAVNTTRWALHHRLTTFGLPVSVGTGGRTGYNRATQGYEKDHWIDAMCVGVRGEQLFIPPAVSPLYITATGRGSRQMCRMDTFGFPRPSAKAAKRVHGFQTGDVVRAVVPSGKHAGTHTGRVAVRSSGKFNITTSTVTRQGIHFRHFTLLQQTDGYAYDVTQKGAAVSPQV